MKDMMTTIASVLVLMMFLLQFTANQTSYTRVMGAEYAVRSFRQTAESAQEISEDAVQDLKTKIAVALRCSAREVMTETRADGVYKVSAPVRGVIGPAAALGIREEDNFFMYQAEGRIGLRDEKSDDHTGTGNPDEPASALPDGTERENLEEPQP